MRKITIGVLALWLGLGGAPVAQERVPTGTPDPGLQPPKFTAPDNYGPGSAVETFAPPPKLPPPVIYKRQPAPALDSWIGADINDYMMKEGAPSGQYKMPNGNVIYTWHSERDIPAPVDLTQLGDGVVGTGGGTMRLACTTSLYTDARGRIFSWKSQGSGC